MRKELENKMDDLEDELSQLRSDMEDFGETEEYLIEENRLSILIDELNDELDSLED